MTDLLTGTQPVAQERRLVPGTELQWAEPPATIVTDLAGADAFGIDDERGGVSAFVLRRELTDDVDPQSPRAAEDIAVRELAALEERGGVGELADVHPGDRPVHRRAAGAQRQRERRRAEQGRDGDRHREDLSTIWTPGRPGSADPDGTGRDVRHGPWTRGPPPSGEAGPTRRQR